MASQRNRTAADVARPPARRLRRTWARWMRRQIARILPPPTPACARGEPRGRVWRGPAVASAARCRSPGAPPRAPSSGAGFLAPRLGPETGRALRARQRVGGAGQGAWPQVLRSWLAARAAWLLDAAAAGRQLRIAAARRRGRGCAAAAPRARQRRRPPRCGSRVSGTAAARKWPHSVPNVANAVRGIP